MSLNIEIETAELTVEETAPAMRVEVEVASVEVELEP